MDQIIEAKMKSYAEIYVQSVQEYRDAVANEQVPTAEYAEAVHRARVKRDALAGIVADLVADVFGEESATRANDAVYREAQRRVGD
jgi:uncharacterized protein (DUF1697 family)